MTYLVKPRSASPARSSLIKENRAMATFLKDEIIINFLVEFL